MNTIKTWCNQLAKTTKMVLILLIVPAVVVVLCHLGMVMGGVLASGVVTGVVTMLSFIFIMINLGLKKSIKIRDFVSKYAGWLDIGQTLVLTYLGFHLGGVTLAISCMTIGLCLSAVFSLLRMWACLDSKVHADHFYAEMA